MEEITSIIKKKKPVKVPASTQIKTGLGNVETKPVEKIKTGFEDSPKYTFDPDYAKMTDVNKAKSNVQYESDGQTVQITGKEYQDKMAGKGFLDTPGLKQIASIQKQTDIQTKAQANIAAEKQALDIATAEGDILNMNQPVGTQPVGAIPGQAQPMGQTGTIQAPGTMGSIQGGTEGSLLPYSPLETYANPVDLRVRDFLENNLKGIVGDDFAESLSNLVLATQAESQKSGAVATSMNIGMRLIKGLFSLGHARGTNSDFNTAEDVANTWIGMIDKELKEGGDPVILNQYIATAEDSLSVMEDEAKYYGMLNAGYWKNQGRDLQTLIFQKRKMLGDLKDEAVAKSIRASAIANYGQ